MRASLRFPLPVQTKLPAIPLLVQTKLPAILALSVLQGHRARLRFQVQSALLGLCLDVQETTM
jgi:hypothetical protein